jgi:hypothetical protein
MIEDLQRRVRFLFLPLAPKKAKEQQSLVRVEHQQLPQSLLTEAYFSSARGPHPIEEIISAMHANG